MPDAFVCDVLRTPLGKFNGSLATVGADDLAALPLKVLMECNPKVNWSALDGVIMGRANLAGEDNRNVARMAVLLSGIPENVPEATVCGLMHSASQRRLSAAETCRQCGQLT